MKVFKQNMKGFITIEYALLLPVLLVVYTFLITIAIYQYNECLLITNLYLIGNQRMELARQEGEGQIDLLEGKRARLYDEKYILVEDMQTKYSVKGNHIEIIGTGKMTNPLASVGVGEEAWEIYAKCEQNVLDATIVLHLYKNIRNQLQLKIPEKE